MHDPLIYPDPLVDALMPPREFAAVWDASGWHVQHRTSPISLRPLGGTTEEQERIVRRVAEALHHVDEAGIPTADWRPPFWAGWIVGLITAAALGIAWKAVTTSWPGLTG